MGIYSKTRDHFRNLIYLNSRHKKLKRNIKPEIEKKYTFPCFDQVKTSILIPFHNQEIYTKNCLASLFKNLPKSSFEIILIDDNSSQKVDLSHFENIKIIRNKINLGFTKSINKALRQAQGEFIYLLNNDTIVHEGFLDELLYVFDHFEDAGAVGSMLLNADGTVQEAGAVILQSSDIQKIINKKNYAPEVNYIYAVDYCSGCSLMFKKHDDTGKLNLFDESYAPAYFEDTDLCMQIKHLQKKSIYYTPFSKVTHFHGVSYDQKAMDSSSEKDLLFAKNRAVFSKKWASKLDQIKSTTKNERLIELNENKFIVFYNGQTPAADTNSGEARLTEIIKAYKRNNYHILLFSSRCQIKNARNEIFQRMGVNVFYETKIYHNAQRFFRKYEKLPALHWFYGPDIFIKHKHIAKSKSSSEVLIYDMVDIHHLRYKRAYETNQNNSGYKRKYQQYLKRESLCLKEADITIAISEEEKRYVKDHFSTKNIEVISNIHYPRIDKEKIPSFEHREGILFIGSTHHPNVDAVSFLIEDIMPKIWEKNPTISVQIIGNINQLFPKSSHPKIQFLGYVPDITDYFLYSKLLVAPLRYGAGVKGKVGQAFEYFLPVVSTSVGAEGMKLKDGESALVADDPLQFAKKIIEVYENKNTWGRLSDQSEKNLRPFSLEHLQHKIKEIEKKTI